MDQTKINYYLPFFSNTRVNKLDMMTEVLSVLSFDELQLFKRKTPVLSQGLLKIPYLKRKSFSEIFTKGRALWNETKDVYGAIAFVILNNAQEINRYIQLKEKLDILTSTQKYEEAHRLLDQIDKEVSVSMMSTYYLLRLTRLDKGITVSTQLYNKICQDNTVLGYISNVAFKSAAIDLPFEAEIEGQYRSFQGQEEVGDFFTAFAFPFKKTKGEKWLRLLLYTSLIDLFEGFIFQLSCLPNEKLKSESLKKIICALATSIQDRRIQRLYSLINNGKTLPHFYDYSEEKTLIDKYYSQDFEYVLSKGQDYLKRNPLEATIIDIFYKSCLKMDQIPDDLFPEDSLAGRIHYFYVLSLTNDDISEACRVQLRSMCIAWFSIPSLRQIYQLFYDLKHSREDSVYTNFWRYSLVPEIRDSLFYNNPNEATLYLKSAGYSEINSNQVHILQRRIDDSFNQTYRLLYGVNDEDVLSLSNKIENEEHTPIITGRIISTLFDHMFRSGKYADAISLYVKCRLKAPFTKIPIDRKSITKELTDVEDSKISNQLELAVFYTMIRAEVYKRYLAYKRYLKQAGFRRASEIDNINSPALIYFVGNVADRNVLTLHILEFDKEEDVANERIELCKKVLNVTNEKKYADEITSLIKEHEVMALAQQVNDSKIHVDVQSLINSGLSNEKILFDTYSEIDENLEMYEQKNIQGILDYINNNYEGKSVLFAYELPSVKYKRVLFRQMVLSIRDKFLFDPIYGLDKYLSARIRHGTLITQLRNHFLTHSLVTNKKEGGEYQRINPWTLKRNASLSESEKEAINERMLNFTIWLDEQLKVVKEEKIQIKTERAEGNVNGLFDYSEEYMVDMIDDLEVNTYDSFEAFVHSTIELLWKWTNFVLERIRGFFQQYEELVVAEMTKLQSEVVLMMGDSTLLINAFKDAITTCRTEFQSDISVVTSWFKPEKSNVRFFTIQQAVDTSLSVINNINQNALSFSSIDINDNSKYSGDYFNAIHDIFHDMMNNILGYERKRTNQRGKGIIRISNIDDKLEIEVSNPVEELDVDQLKKVIEDQRNIPSMIAGGKTRRENNSGCVKIYSTVMYTLGIGNKYENLLKDGRFVAHIIINTKKLIYHEDSIS